MDAVVITFHLGGVQNYRTHLENPKSEMRWRGTNREKDEVTTALKLDNWSWEKDKNIFDKIMRWVVSQWWRERRLAATGGPAAKS